MPDSTQSTGLAQGAYSASEGAQQRIGVTALSTEQVTDELPDGRVGGDLLRRQRLNLLQRPDCLQDPATLPVGPGDVDQEMGAPLRR